MLTSASRSSIHLRKDALAFQGFRTTKTTCVAVPLEYSGLRPFTNATASSTSSNLAVCRNVARSKRLDGIKVFVAAPPRLASAPSTAPEPASTSAGTAVQGVQVAVPPVPLSFEGRAGLYDASGRLLLKNLTLAEMEEWCEAIGEPARRARQLYRWLYGAGRWMRSLDDADGDSQAFSAAFKAKAAPAASLSGGITLQSVHAARDGTRKLVFALHPQEGGATGSVETVLIPMTNRQGQNMRFTACLSTQVGCAMNCQFCYTGRMGLLGNLSTAQIVEQVVEARRYLASEGVNVPIANIVFMGMGEPLHNYDAVLSSIDILAEGLELSRNKIIVSTVGLVPQMRSFLQTGKAKLALSLHATTDEVRDWIVPTNRRYPLHELMSLLKEYFPIADGRGDRFVVIEYVMLKGVNDSEEDARRLLDLTADIYCMVNLIVFNPHDGTRFERSDDDAVRAFRGVLLKAGRVCTVRVSKGDDTMAACGQLGDVSASPRPAPLLPPPSTLQPLFAGAGQEAR